MKHLKFTRIKTINIDDPVKSLQGRHSRERGNDENESFLIFYEFVNIQSQTG
jgi:hypothetical protein